MNKPVPTKEMFIGLYDILGRNPETMNREVTALYIAKGSDVSHWFIETEQTTGETVTKTTTDVPDSIKNYCTEYFDIENADFVTVLE